MASEEAMKLTKEVPVRRMVTDQWSLDDGVIQISCPYPLTPNEAKMALEWLSLIQNRWQRMADSADAIDALATATQAGDSPAAPK